MNNITLKLDKCYQDTYVDVDYEYSYDPGQWTLCNGDPGYPEIEGIEIQTIFTSNDIMGIFDVYTLEQLEDELTSKISEFHREKKFT